MKESQKRLCLRAGKSGWIFLMLLFVILFSRANTHAVVREFRVQGFDIMSRALILSMEKREINMIHIIVAAGIRFQSILT